MLTDCTLASLDAYEAQAESLLCLLREIERLPVDAVELSVSVYEKLRAFEPCMNTQKKYFLCIRHPAERSAYPGFAGYLLQEKSKVSAEENEEIPCLDLYGKEIFVRRRGFDRLIGIASKSTFEKILQNGKRNELAPRDTFHCATALSVTWLLMGGYGAAASLAGTGGYGCTEEILMALYLQGAVILQGELSALQSAKSLLEEITGQQLSGKKPVLGSDIFAVEAGIHVDGVVKEPRLYEPYPPALVGLQRHLVIGKYSGRSALLAKARELHIQLEEKQLARLIERLQRKSVGRQARLSEEAVRQFLLDAAD